MGAWGIKNFENDDALDWILELEQAEDGSVLEETLKVVTEHGEEYLEAPEACRALAAAEVVAALNHAGPPDLPDEVQQWVSHHRLGNPMLTQLALSAIQRIKTNSELKELWDESASAPEWYEVVSNLETRLNR
jgi:hypothetical protein